MISTLKRLLLESQLPDWRHAVDLEDGYTILLPSPMDIPFMLRIGLEGLQHIDTSRCKQILVVPDGWGDDDGRGLKKVIEEFSDPRIEYVELTRRDYRLIRSMRPPGCAATHWMLVVNGTLRARCEYAFLHDADAFFLETGGLERQYEKARTQSMHTLGVTPRWDPFFTGIAYVIPGTWELMYSVAWARSRKPFELKGRKINTPHGEHVFDSMLYPQYLDYPTGKIRVMDDPPSFVHFNGTIFSYRIYRDRGRAPITDEFFRVLLLSVLEEALAPQGAQRVLPPASRLADGLTEPCAPVLYQSEKNRLGYGEFRSQVEAMWQSPVFSEDRLQSMRRALEPFDEHFGFDPDACYAAALAPGEMRTVGVRP